MKCSKVSVCVFVFELVRVCSMHTVRDNSGDDDDVDATLDLDNFSGNI